MATGRVIRADICTNFPEAAYRCLKERRTRPLKGGRVLTFDGIADGGEYQRQGKGGHHAGEQCDGGNLKYVHIRLLGLGALYAPRNQVML